jgi:colanic acid/amylovoran biosynthesis protein
LGFIDWVAHQGGMVTLFAQCRGPSQSEDDRRVVRRLDEQVGCSQRIVLVEDALTPEALQAAYGQMDYFVGTRMHSVILALNAGVPALAIGYLAKTAGIMEDLGLAHRCLDIGTLTDKTLIDAFQHLMCAPEQPGVSDYLAQAQRAKQDLVALLRATMRLL